MSRRRYACDGTPTDSVLLALNHLLKDRRPALLLSGVNRGGNLGEDISYSGTVAAAMEATLLGVPSIALSLALPWGEHPHWATAEHFAPDLIRKLVAKGWPRNVLINVNFPHRSADRVQGARLARQGRRKIGDSLVQGKDPRGVPYWWIGDSRTEDRRVAGSDLDTVQDGFISVTPIHLDMTHGPTMSALRQAIE
jgi:5'-nucleotidase